MKLFKNIFFVSIISVFYVNIGFASSKEWNNNSIDSIELGNVISLTIFENGLGNKNVAIVVPFDDCLTFNATPIEAPSMYINSTKVQMMAQCISKGVRMDFPKTEAGINYLINELKTKNKVFYKQGGETITFNTKGFTKAYDNFESTSGGL